MNGLIRLGSLICLVGMLCTGCGSDPRYMSTLERQLYTKRPVEVKDNRDKFAKSAFVSTNSLTYGSNSMIEMTKDGFTNRLFLDSSHNFGGLLTLGAGEYEISCYTEYKDEMRLVYKEFRKIDEEVAWSAFLGTGNFCEKYYASQSEWYKSNELRDEEFVEAACRYIGENFEYDAQEAAWNATSKYPTAHKTNFISLEHKKKGIYIDFASLLCSLCRARSIPAKYVEGTRVGDGEHAWVEVFLDGEWKIYDPTVAVLTKGKELTLDSSLYEPRYIF